MRDIVAYQNELRFYERDGWEEEILLSILEQGSIEFREGYYRLSHREPVASFNVARLMEIAGDVYDTKGSRFFPRARNVALKYMSQHGVFNWGDKHEKRS